MEKLATFTGDNQVAGVTGSLAGQFDWNNDVFSLPFFRPGLWGANGGKSIAKGQTGLQRPGTGEVVKAQGGSCASHIAEPNFLVVLLTGSGSALRCAGSISCRLNFLKPKHIARNAVYDGLED